MLPNLYRCILALPSSHSQNMRIICETCFNTCAVNTNIHANKTRQNCLKEFWHLFTQHFLNVLSILYGSWMMSSSKDQISVLSFIFAASRWFATKISNASVKNLSCHHLIVLCQNWVMVLLPGCFLWRKVWQTSKESQLYQLSWESDNYRVDCGHKHPVWGTDN